MIKGTISLLKKDTTDLAPKDRMVRLFGIPLVAVALTFYHPGKEVILETNFFSTLFITLCYTYLHWEGIRYFIVKLRYLYQDPNSTVKRIVIQIVVAILFTAFVSFFICSIVNNYIFNIAVTWDFSLINFKISLVATFFITSIYECFYFFSLWKKSIVESEKLKRENLISQFETLKNQVNPHFLFNSFNTLITIIPENQEVAVQFVQKLSNVYRYVLQNKDKELVDLSIELSFLDDYIFLHKIRFGENLRIDVDIHPDLLKNQIAPLTLQMLMENAVKHNVISSDKPLLVKIYVEKNKVIVVENNLQKRSTPVESTKIGLQNIINRYTFLSEKLVEVVVTSSVFKVSLPLLLIEKNESTNR